MSNSVVYAVLDRQQTLAKSNYENLENRCGYEYHRGLLTRAEYAELVQHYEAAFDEYCTFQCLAVGALLNVQLAQKAYCTVRTIPLTHKEAQSAGLAQLDERAHRRIAFEQWASPLELLANSLNAHAPPQFFDRQNYWQVAQE